VSMYGDETAGMHKLILRDDLRPLYH